jgi:hypothetical protein
MACGRAKVRKILALTMRIGRRISDPGLRES